MALRTKLLSSPTMLIIRRATNDDKGPISKFITKFFVPDEPLNKYIGLDKQDELAEVEGFHGQNFSDATLVAEINGKIIGVCISEIVDKNPKETDKHKELLGKFAKIHDLITFIKEKSNPFQHFPEASKAMAIQVVCVDRTYRSKGIAKRLIEKTREITRETECSFIVMECTSHFSAMAAERLGFEKIYSLDYANYKPHGEVVFDPEAPHKAATVYVQKM